MKDYRKILYALLYESLSAEPATSELPEKGAPAPKWGPDNPDVVSDKIEMSYNQMVADIKAKQLERERQFDIGEKKKAAKAAADKVELDRRREEVRNSTTKSGGVDRALTRGEANAQVPGAYPSPTTYAEQDVQDLQIKMSVVNAARGTNNPSESRAAWQVAQAVETERNRMNSSWRPSPGMPAEWNRQDREDFDKYRSGKTTAESNKAREADRVAERVRTTGTKRPDEFISTTDSDGNITTTDNPNYSKVDKSTGDWDGQSQADTDSHKTQAWKNLQARRDAPGAYERRKAAVKKQAERTAFVMSPEGRKERRQIEIDRMEAQAAYFTDRGDDKSYAAHLRASNTRRLHLAKAEQARKDKKPAAKIHSTPAVNTNIGVP